MNRFAILIATLFMAGSVGCSPTKTITRTYDKPVPDSPPAGNVRILAQKIRQDAEAVHWRWTIVGDRSWSSSSGDGRVMELGDSSALDATYNRAGTNAWELDLIIDTANAAGGVNRLRDSFSLKSIGTTSSDASQVTWHGEGGVSTSGHLPWDLQTQVRVADVAKAMLTTEQMFELPAEVSLLEVSSDGSVEPASRQIYGIRLKE